MRECHDFFCHTACIYSHWVPSFEQGNYSSFFEGTFIHRGTNVYGIINWQLLPLPRLDLQAIEYLQSVVNTPSQYETLLLSELLHCFQTHHKYITLLILAN